ncbi:MAG TPA: D-glycero-beta-D-manno-heptose 1-phosphate adenylyltransferase [Baekduia sp.]|uniref:D-glycero-beta-D-manno-heptose 1-phosphate adenylyltransferase n=1 Tax=Baekduia sp. TaxID=2600305 RepID=UPI002C7B63C2|nr:D-glycero-beta-D-manno-heptose 1-phosphate adenylyltransferase [Baekduia sp.]HMJ35059.1 D-glycero-beta-D-manno-heptose 1-phosphate adenylyltransferase [Baekduia sp.]
MSTRLAIVGDALLDRDVDGTVHHLAPDAPVPVVDHERTTVRPGGAGLAATLAVADGHAVRLVTALATDAAGGELRAALEDGGVEVVDLGHTGATPEKIRIRDRGRALLRLDRGVCRGTVGAATAAARAAIEWADAVLVADYGRGVTAESGVRMALDHAVAAERPTVWDPHPHGPQPVRGVTLVTPNGAEAAGFAATARGTGDAAHALLLRERWGAVWVCVTRGAGGALLAGPAVPFLVVPAQRTLLGDPCGAGDRFATRAAAVLAAGATVPEAVRVAVAAASAFVAAGGASTIGVATAPARPPAATDDDPEALIARVRARGGTVVATGGCFDLLHAGHVQTLRAARALGDCLVVCLNSDASVRCLKGPRRPLVAQDDRAAVLRALRCVDAVAIFDEDTPTEILRTLRPDVWAKGGDYAAAELPEAAVIAGWRGRSVVLPFLAGHSTTRLIEEVSLHAV